MRSSREMHFHLHVCISVYTGAQAYIYVVRIIYLHSTTYSLSWPHITSCFFLKSIKIFQKHNLMPVQYMVLFNGF